MRKAEDQKNLVEIAEVLPEEARDIRTNDAGVRDKSAAKGRRLKTAGATASGTPETGKSSAIKNNSAEPAHKKSSGKHGTGSAKGKPSAKRAKAKKPNEKITPAYIFKKMLAFGKIYQIEEEQDFMEAARIYSEEAALIDQMRDRLDEDGLTVMKTYKTGDVEVAHPLLSELPRHVESANKCLMTISSMIEDRGAKKQKPTRELDKFRLHA